MQGIAGFRLGPLAHLARQGFIGNNNLAGLTVEFEKHRALSIRQGIAKGQKADDKRLALLNVYAHFFTGSQAVKENRRRQNARVRILALMSGKVSEYPRIKQIS